MNDEIHPRVHLEPEPLRLTNFEQVIEKNLVQIMAAMGILQLLFSGFAFADRLNPTVPSKYVLITVFIDSRFWAGCYFISGLLSLIAVRRRESRALATAISAAAFGIWGTLCIILSFTSVEPIAWSIGFAVAALGWVSYKLCLVWGLTEFDPIQGT